MVKKIIACADIHFKNLQGIDELKEVLKGFLQQCKEIIDNEESPDNVRIVVAGDIFDSKISISNEANVAVDWFFKELNKLKNNKLGTIQLSNAKNQLVGQLALSSESGLGELLSMTRSSYSQEGIEPLSETVKKIRNLKADDILNVANEIFDNRNINLMIYKGL